MMTLHCEIMTKHENFRMNSNTSPSFRNHGEIFVRSALFPAFLIAALIGPVVRSMWSHQQSSRPPVKSQHSFEWFFWGKEEKQPCLFRTSFPTAKVWKLKVWKGLERHIFFSSKKGDTRNMLQRTVYCSSLQGCNKEKYILVCLGNSPHSPS